MKNNIAIQLIEKENVTFATVKRIRVLFDFNDSTFPPWPQEEHRHKGRKRLGNLELSNFHIYGLKTRVASPSCGLLDIHTKGVTKKDRQKLA